MILQINKHISLVENHPTLPNWIFHRDNTILSQEIQLGEDHMRELLIFLDHYSINFNQADLKISAVEFEEITLEYC